MKRVTPPLMQYTSLKKVAYFYIEASVYGKLNYRKCTHKLNDFSEIKKCLS